MAAAVSTPTSRPSRAPRSVTAIDSTLQHPAQLRPVHPDRAEQADLAGPLDDAERERVDDAEDGDQDRQRQQHPDDRGGRVDRAAGLGGIGLLVADLDRRVVLQRLQDRRAGPAPVLVPSATSTYRSESAGAPPIASYVASETTTALS